MNLIEGEIQGGTFRAKDTEIAGLDAPDGKITLGFRAEDANVVPSGGQALAQRPLPGLRPEQRDAADIRAQRPLQARHLNSGFSPGSASKIAPQSLLATMPAAGMPAAGMPAADFQSASSFQPAEGLKRSPRLDSNSAIDATRASTPSSRL